MGRTLLPSDELDCSQHEEPNVLQISQNMQNKVKQASIETLHLLQNSSLTPQFQSLYKCWTPIVLIFHVLSAGRQTTQPKHISVIYPNISSEKTLPKALRTQALTALTNNFGLVGLVQYAW